jgi:hypothetical protein
MKFLRKKGKFEIRNYSAANKILTNSKDVAVKAFSYGSLLS